MSRVSFVNGKYLSFKNAKIAINDRSVQFSDSVYEVIAVIDSNLVFWEEHLKRLKKSLKLMNIKNFKNLELLLFKCKEVIKLNNLDEGLIYIQISRGAALRNHNWQDTIMPSLIISCLHEKVFEKRKPISLISHLDIRWRYNYIKSTSLLGNVLLKQKALKKNAFECLMYDDKGLITEATTSNIWIIKNKTIFTPPLKKNILGGVTRQKIFEIAKAHNIKAAEKEIKLKTLSNVDGVFLTNSSSLIIMAKKLDNLKLKLDKDNIFLKLYNGLLSTVNKH